MRTLLQIFLGIVAVMLVIAIIDAEISPGSSFWVMGKVKYIVHLTALQLDTFIKFMWFDFGQYIVIGLIIWILWKVIKK